jgi:hypothetical protein
MRGKSRCSKILKSGCRGEDSKLRTAERLANLMVVFCILSWRVLWLTMLNRTAPDASPKMASRLRAFCFSTLNLR